MARWWPRATTPLWWRGTTTFRVRRWDDALLEASDTQSYCPWKGTASYFHLTAGGETSRDAVWYYPDPKEAASMIDGRVAFWNGVEVVR